MISFAEALVERLEREGLLVLVPGGRERAVLFLGNRLSMVSQGGSLLSGIDQAFLLCAEVDEVFYELDDLKQAVEDLRP
jgi:hypothetical protein